MNVKKLIVISLLISIGIVMQLLESMIPVFTIVPGFKLGLANIVSLVALELYDSKAMVQVGIGRVLLASLLQGTFLSVAFWLSLCGGILSLMGMVMAYRSQRFSLIGISIIGAACHHIGQVVTITFLYQQYYMQMYLPILLALSIVSGMMMALVGQKVIQRLESRKEG